MEGRAGSEGTYRSLRPTIQIGWGDVSTAFHSTGIPNIEVRIQIQLGFSCVIFLDAGLNVLEAAICRDGDHRRPPLGAGTAPTRRGPPVRLGGGQSRRMRSTLSPRHRNSS